MAEQEILKQFGSWSVTKLGLWNKAKNYEVSNSDLHSRECIDYIKTVEWGDFENFNKALSVAKVYHHRRLNPYTPPKVESVTRDEWYKHKGIASGFYVAILLKKGTAPERCYVGLVESTDDNGVRLTLLDWEVKECVSWDLYVAWGNIESAMIATPNHYMNKFLDEAMKWVRTFNEHPFK